MSFLSEIKIVISEKAKKRKTHLMKSRNLFNTERENVVTS